jgi:hypothetical protein
MRNLRFALCALFLPVAGLWAAGDQKEEQQAPDEIPNFSQLDEFIYVPKTTLSLGSRFFLHGPKTTYSGQGINPSTVSPGDDSTLSVPNIARTYIDGSVLPDGRQVPVAGGLGSTNSVPIASDGRTNSWSYDNASQLLPNGDIQFHTYSGEITDTSSHSVDGAPNSGVELTVDRDMGKIGKRIKWSISAGFSIGDIHSSTFVSVPTTLTTLTDTYDLFGQVPPAAPFNSPNNISQAVLGAGSVTVSGTGSGLTSTTQNATQTILLGNSPISRTEVPTSIFTTSRYFNEGAFYTLRVGPAFMLPMGNHLKLNASAGPALIYSGSILNVLEDLNVATGEDFTQLYQRQNSKLLPGYYVDVDLQYQLTDTAGFYVGGLYEGAGSYSQSVASGAGTAYTSRIDFGSQEAVTGGVTVRF